MKLFIAIPCYSGKISVRTFYSLEKLKMYLDDKKIFYGIFTSIGDSLIPRVRNDLAMQMLNDQNNFSHLLFIDDDIGFEIDNFIRLKNLNKEISCGVYPKRIMNWNKLKKTFDNNKSDNLAALQSKALEYNVNFLSRKEKIIDGFARVRHGPTGFMLVKRVVFEKMISSFKDIKYYEHLTDDVKYDFFRVGVDKKTEAKPRYLSEDYYFCESWINIGGEIWADLQSALTHTGYQTFTGSYIETIS